MSSVFLSHTSIDKPFVEKIAKDLKRLGVKVWFDKWEIKVGESLLWKIDEGIRENEFLAIVLSPAALKSDWVKHEISAAFAKQMKTKKIVLLPILYQECELPYFLSDTKYADFQTDYQLGIAMLAETLGIEAQKQISEENWRRFVRKKGVDWKYYREREFEKLVTVLIDRAIEYNWFAWVGGRKSYSITLSAMKENTISKSVSIRLDGKSYQYVGSLIDTSNPNKLKSSDYTESLGYSINQCEEFVWRHMEDFRAGYGDPIEVERPFHEKFLSEQEKFDLAKMMIKEMSWNKGDKL